MNHEPALQAARVNELDSIEYVESIVRGFLEARAEPDDACTECGYPELCDHNAAKLLLEYFDDPPR